MNTHPLTVRLNTVRQQISAAALQAGRDPHEIRLIGVTKTHPASTIADAITCGLGDVGENRVQEAEAKIHQLHELRAQVRWHLIGHLQSNKARRAAQLFDMIQSVDSVKLAEALDRHAAERAQPLEILLQVNVSGEESKEGFALANWQEHPDRLAMFFEQIAQLVKLTNLRVCGLMTIAPIGTLLEAQQHFNQTRLLRDQLQQQFPANDWSQLSMGMSDDFAAAIAEGATMIRIGRAIFGAR
jgi:PLP dependent protein